MNDTGARSLEGTRTTGPDSGSHFRSGLVVEQSAGTGRVRVRFPDRDGLVSWWIPVLVRKSQEDKQFSLPDLGEQVACLMDARDEDGVVLGAIYSTADAPPAGLNEHKDHTTYQDGAVVEYDRDTHVLTAALPAASTVEASQGAGSLTRNTQGDLCGTALIQGASCLAGVEQGLDGQVAVAQGPASRVALTQASGGLLAITQADGGVVALVQGAGGTLTLTLGAGGLLTIAHPAGASVVIDATGGVSVVAATMVNLTAPVVNLLVNDPQIVSGNVHVDGYVKATGDIQGNQPLP